MAIICDHQSKKLPSCVARQMAMIYFEKSNIPNASETNRCSCNGRHFIESFDYKYPVLSALVSCSETATVWFRFTGNNSTRQPTLFCVFNIVGAMCGRVRSSWKVFALEAFSRFLADCNRKYCAFLIKEMLFSKIWFKRLKHNYVRRTGLAR